MESVGKRESDNKLPVYSTCVNFLADKTGTSTLAAGDEKGVFTVVPPDVFVRQMIGLFQQTKSSNSIVNSKICNFSELS